MYTIISMILLLQVQSGTSFGNLHLIQSNPVRAEVKVETYPSYIKPGVVHTDFFQILIRSNEYQTVKETYEEKYGTILQYGPAGDSCVHYHIELGQNAAQGKYIDLKQHYAIEAYDVEIDFGQIDSIYPYDASSEIFRYFTKSNEPFIDTKNDALLKISDSIWNEDTNTISYARNCFDYVAEHFEYRDPLSGFHPLDTLLKYNGGDCGNLSTIYITLLRQKGIPARHIVGFRPDQSLHVWTEFYLEKYGWIPQDITYRQEDPKGDYFGKILFENNGFVLHRGIGHVVPYPGGVTRIPSLQTFSFQERYSDPNHKTMKLQWYRSIKLLD